MPEYVWIVGLILYGLHVGCQVVATKVAHRTCQMTCKLMEKQAQAMRELG